MVKPIKDVLFKDFDSAFVAHPITGALKTVINADAVKQAVENTVLTNKYERLYAPTNYTNVRRTLFETITQTTADFLRQRIRFALKNFEPRASLYDVIVDIKEDQNDVAITVVFSVDGQLQPVVVNVFLERVR